MSLLEMRSISKSFGSTKALADVDFTVEKGEIHALLGENGAGKSTLMNILTGVEYMDAGSIMFDGRQYTEPTIRQMEHEGIAFVHQELNVVNDLTVYENIFLNRELSIGPLLNNKAMIRRTEELFSQMSVGLNPRRMVAELKTSEKQFLEICRALYIDAKLFILDEPTTALSNDEIEHLFAVLRVLRDKGKSFVFISHKMPEIFAVADRYTVLRNGVYISCGDVAGVTPHQVTSDMVGEQYVNRDDYAPRATGDTALALRGFTGQGFRDVNLEIKRGEIVAFTGLAGSGANEMIQTLFGAMPVESGYLEVNGKRIDGGINRVMKSGVAMLPSNRKEKSMIPDMNILENTYIAEHALSRRKPLINKNEEISKYECLKEQLFIKSNRPEDPINSLSGGNQQKVFLARWLNTGAQILLFDNPTQGVDVSAKVEIYKLMLDLAADGKTVLINTLEIPEIKKVSDRCVVFYEGEVVKIFSHDEIEEHTIMLYSTNAINMGGGRRPDSKTQME